MIDKLLDFGMVKVRDYMAFEEKRQKLERERNVLEHRASDVIAITENAELLSGKKRKQEVEEWLKEVERKKIQCLDLIEEARDPGIFSRIKLARRVDAMIEIISNLTQQRESFGALLLDVDETKGVPLVTIEWRGPSFERNLEEIWAQLMNEKITSVGIYGMGGVGKTTLAKSIHNALLLETTFSSQVYWVTASQEASIHKLQNDIAKAIKLDLSDEDDEMKRAANLFQALKRREKFVILVDDLWTDFDVNKMGIPLQRSKIIVTSRSIEVCRKIGCQIQIKMTPLCQEEAWELFKWKLGRGEELPSDVKKIAKSMAEKSAGLPLAILTMAGSMKGVDDIYEWRNALEELEQCSIGEDDAVFPILEYSYNRLKNQRLKDCFLCCSLYPEDWKIKRDELIKLFISEGLIERKSRQLEFDCGHTILNKLENVCLLEGDENSDGKYVKMHDLIREMALKITKSGKPKYMVKAGIELKGIPEEREWEEDLEKVSLMHNNIQLIPSGNSPKCSKLSTLLLKRNGLRSISDSFFDYLGELQILDLSYNHDLTKLPDSISDLKNLKALLLHCCVKLNSVPPLGNLEALRELDLYETNIDEVPEGLERLVKLRSLNMLRTKLRNIPDGLLSRLCSLRLLLIPYDVEVRAEELEALKDLEKFEFRFNDVGNLNQFVRSYQNHVGPIFFLIMVGPPVDPIEQPHYNESQMIDRTVDLVGSGLEGGTSEILLPNGIKDLFIRDSNEIKWILKSISSQSSFSSSSANHVAGGGIIVEEDEGHIGISPCAATLQRLKFLCLFKLPHLLGLLKWESAIADATLPSPIFPCLKTLRIYLCPRVTKLFTPKLLLQHLPNLEVLDIALCYGLEEIITTEDEDTTVVQVSLPKLKHLKLECLPKFRSIYKGTLICDSIKIIKIVGCSNLKRIPLFLPTIKGQLSPPPALRQIYISSRETEWWESLEWDNPQLCHVMQPFLHYDGDDDDDDEF